MGRDVGTVSADENIQEIVEGLVAEYQALLGLDCWRIDVIVVKHAEGVESTDDLEDEACCVFDDGYYSVSLYLNAWRVKPEDLEETVAHEMCHIALRELDRLAHYAVPKRMRKHVKEAVDRAVTQLSRALARMRENTK